VACLKQLKRELLGSYKLHSNHSQTKQTKPNPSSSVEKILFDSSGRTLRKGTRKHQMKGREMHMQQTNCGIV